MKGKTIVTLYEIRKQLQQLNAVLPNLPRPNEGDFFSWVFCDLFKMWSIVNCISTYEKPSLLSKMAIIVLKVAYNRLNDISKLREKHQYRFTSVLSY